jgi:hypothetical protein
MRDGKYSKRDLLRVSTALVASAAFAKSGRTPLSTIKLMTADPAVVAAQSEEIKARYSKIFGSVRLNCRDAEPSRTIRPCGRRRPTIEDDVAGFSESFVFENPRSFPICGWWYCGAMPTMLPPGMPTSASPTFSPSSRRRDTGLGRSRPCIRAIGQCRKSVSSTPTRGKFVGVTV